MSNEIGNVGVNGSYCSISNAMGGTASEKAFETINNKRELQKDTVSFGSLEKDEGNSSECLKWGIIGALGGASILAGIALCFPKMRNFLSTSLFKKASQESMPSNSSLHSKQLSLSSKQLSLPSEPSSLLSEPIEQEPLTSIQEFLTQKTNKCNEKLEILETIECSAQDNDFIDQINNLYEDNKKNKMISFVKACLDTINTSDEKNTVEIDIEKFKKLKEQYGLKGKFIDNELPKWENKKKSKVNLIDFFVRYRGHVRGKQFILQTLDKEINKEKIDLKELKELYTKFYNDSINIKDCESSYELIECKAKLLKEDKLIEDKLPMEDKILSLYKKVNGKWEIDPTREGLKAKYIEELSEKGETGFMLQEFWRKYGIDRNSFNLKEEN